jgi:hypothetical protein
MTTDERIHLRRTFRNAFAALAAIFKNRQADLAWPERSKGKKVPAKEFPAPFIAPRLKACPSIFEFSSFASEISDLPQIPSCPPSKHLV